MDTAQIMVTLGGSLLIIGTLWFFFGKKAGTHPSAAEARYACPMHPWITSSDPSAECSVCGMKLTRSGDDRN